MVDCPAPPLVVTNRRAEEDPVPASLCSPAQLWRDQRGELVAYWYSRGDRHWFHWPGVASYRFGGGAACVTGFVENSTSPDLVEDVYLRAVLPMVVQAMGQEVLHASAVVMGSGVVAFCGDSLVGKSTIAYGLHERGFALWADDALCFQITAGRSRTVQLPFRLKLRPASASHFGLGNHLVRLPLHRLESGSPSTPSWPLNLVVLLRRKSDSQRGPVGRGPGVDSSPTPGLRVRRLPASAALPGILAQAYCFDPGNPERKQQMLRRYLQLTANTPAIEVSFHPSLTDIPRLLSRIQKAVREVAGCNDPGSALAPPV